MCPVAHVILKYRAPPPAIFSTNVLPDNSAREFTERQASLVKVMAAHAAEIIPVVSAAPDAPDDFVDLQDLLGRST